MVELAFYKAPGNIVDHTIRWVTRSPYSHVEIRDSEGRGWSASGRDGCVRIKEIDWKPGHWDFVDVDWVSEDDALERIKPELGAGYDYLGIFLSQVLSLSRSHPDKWFCSEIVAHALGFPQPHRYSPGELFDTLQFIGRGFVPRPR